jgi:hypothetical protein
MKLAPALIALVIFIGVLMYFFYPRVVINPSTNSYPNETFTTNPTSNDKQIECEKVYQACYSNAGTPAECTLKMNECLGIQPTAPTTTSQPVANTTATASAPVTSEVQSTLTSNLNDLVNKLNLTGTTPSNTNLAMIQGGAFITDNIGNPPTRVGGSITNPTPVTKEQILAAYEASQKIIKPHQQVPEYKANVAISVPTDKGTLAEKIRLESVATPSIRQNIRQEIDDVVKDELNPYSVTYQMS